MSHAYSYYYVPLAYGLGFGLIGLLVLKKLALPRYHRLDRFVAVLFILVGLAMILGVLLTSPTPGQRGRLFEDIFHTPANEIVGITLQSDTNGYKPLLQAPVTIRDVEKIRAIAGKLAGAIEVRPNHPRPNWTVQVRMETTKGLFAFNVNATPRDDNGTLIYVSSRAGWNLGSFRADGLETLLEEAAGTRRAVETTLPVTRTSYE
jgi:hypothetical protein